MALQHFAIRIHGAGPGKDGLYADVAATTVDAAIKRVLAGGYQAGYKFAQVGDHRATLARGKTLTVTARRL